MASVDYIEQYGMTAEEYAAKSTEERDQIADEFVQSLVEAGKTPEEIEEEIDAIEETFDEIQELYEGYLNDIPSDSELYATIQSIIDACDEGKDGAGDSYTDYQKHNTELEDGENVNIGDIELDGSTYVYELNGGDVFMDLENVTLVSADTANGVYIYKTMDDEGNYAYVEIHINDSQSTNPFASSDTSDADYLKDEGVTNDAGEVVTDFNADGFMNQADIDDALEARDGNPLSNEKTDIYFTKGISADDLETIKNNWPTELLQMCYWGDSTTSFYEELFESDADDAVNLSVIEGYDAAVSGLSTVEAYADTSLGDLADEAQAAMDALFAYFDDPTGKSVTEIWGEIFASWSSLSEEEKAVLIQHLTFSVAAYAGDKFATLFGPVVSTLESMLDYDTAMSTADKTAILLLETIGAPGINGGSPILWTVLFSPDGETEGKWKDNAENTDAIAAFITLMTQGGHVVPGEAYTAQNKNAAIEDSHGGASGSSSYAQEFEDAYNTLLGKATKGLTQNEWEEVLNSVTANLFDSNGNLVDNAAQVLIDACGRGGVLEGEDFDDALCNLIYYLKNTMSDAFLEELFTYSNSQALLNALNSDGGTEATYQDEAESYLRSMMS